MATIGQQAPPNAAPVPRSPSTPLDGTGWHFPGPSSKYHTRERARTHSRTNSGIPQPAGPRLHTERKAHRRAQSSFVIPTIDEFDRSSTAQRFFNPHTHRPHRITSPIESRSPLSRFSSFDSSNSTTMNAHGLLATPARPFSLSRQNSTLQDSPFSDYYTDDGRSVDMPSQALPSAETQQLLLRLNKLQSALMRGENGTQALHIVDRRIKEIESDMDSLHSQSRQSPELDESGLFLEELEEERRDSPQQDDQKNESESLADAHDVSDTLSEKDKLLLRHASDMLKALSESNQNLRQRCDDLRAMREQYISDLARKNAVIEEKKTMLEHLIADRQLDRTEMLAYRSHIMYFVNNARTRPGCQALDDIKDIRHIAKHWYETIADIDARSNAFDARDNGLFVSQPVRDARWQVSTVRAEDGSLRSLVLYRNPHPTVEEKCDLSLEQLIDSAELTIQHAHQSQYVNAGTQTKAIQRDHGVLLSNELSSMRLDDDYSSDEQYDDEDNSLHRRRPVLVRPDDDDNHSCAVTTSPASEADLDEAPTGGFAGFMNAMSDFIDESSEDESAGVFNQLEADDATINGPIRSQSDATTDMFWQTLMEIAGLRNY